MSAVAVAYDAQGILIYERCERGRGEQRRGAESEAYEVCEVWPRVRGLERRVERRVERAVWRSTERVWPGRDARRAMRSVRCERGDDEGWRGEALTRYYVMAAFATLSRTHLARDEERGGVRLRRPNARGDRGLVLVVEGRVDANASHTNPQRRRICHVAVLARACP
jgi:hypothetical protein